MAATRGSATDAGVKEYIAARETVETESRPYSKSEIPDDMLAALDAIADRVEEKTAKQRFFTVYDKYNVTSQIAEDRLGMILKEKNQKTGERFFTARPRPDVAVPLQSMCEECEKTISENPYMHGSRPVRDSDDKAWRQDVLAYPHYYRRHRSAIPRRFPDRNQRDELHRYTIGDGR